MRAVPPYRLEGPTPATRNSSLVRDRRGLTAVEYATFAVALISIAMLAAHGLGNGLRTAVEVAAGQINGAPSSPTRPGGPTVLLKSGPPRPSPSRERMALGLHARATSATPPPRFLPASAGPPQGSPSAAEPGLHHGQTGEAGARPGPWSRAGRLALDIFTEITPIGDIETVLFDHEAAWPDKALAAAGLFPPTRIFAKAARYVRGVNGLDRSRHLGEVRKPRGPSPHGTVNQCTTAGVPCAGRPTGREVVDPPRSGYEKVPGNASVREKRTWQWYEEQVQRDLGGEPQLRYRLDKPKRYGKERAVSNNIYPDLTAKDRSWYADAKNRNWDHPINSNGDDLANSLEKMFDASKIDVAKGFPQAARARFRIVTNRPLPPRVHNQAVNEFSRRLAKKYKLSATEVEGVRSRIEIYTKPMQKP